MNMVDALLGVCEYGSCGVRDCNVVVGCLVACVADSRCNSRYYALSIYCVVVI